MNGIRLFFISLFFQVLYNPFCLAQETETPIASVEAKIDLAIPDHSTDGVSHTITLPGFGSVESLEVALQISHPIVEQLYITLTGPEGQTVVLHSNTPSSQNPFSPVYESTTASFEPLSPFIGIEGHGNWILTVYDFGPGARGTLTGWGLRVRPSSLLQTPEPTPKPVVPDSYREGQKLGVEVKVSNLHAADFNQDGIEDVILLSETGNAALLYPSNGDLFIDSPPPPLIDVPKPQKVVDAYINNDPWLDLVFATQDALVKVTTLRVFLGNAEGGFNEHFTTQVNTSMETLAAFDWNGDDKTDLILGGTPYWLPGTGEGSFQAATPIVPTLGRQLLAVGDLDRNGRTDLLATISRGGTSPFTDAYVIFNQGNTTAPSLYPRVKANFDTAILSHFRQASFVSFEEPDVGEFVIVADSGETDPIQWLITVKGAPDQSVSAETFRLAAGSIETPFRAGDVNSDGIEELVFSANSGAQVFAYSDGSNAETTVNVFSGASLILTEPGRYLNDGSTGIAAINGNNELLLLRPKEEFVPTPTPAGTPTPSPTPFLFPTFTPTPVLTATPTPSPTIKPTSTPTPGKVNPDINGDGIVDKRDLLILMEWWGRTVESGE